MENSLSPNVPMETGMVEDTVNLHHYWHVILERRWLVITAFISVFVCCLIYLFKAPRIYQATAVVQIDSESENVLSNIRDAFAVDGRAQDYLQTQYKNLRSRKLIQSVIAALKLNEDPRYKPSPDIATTVLGDIAIVPIRLSRLVEIKASHTSAKIAERMANTLADTFVGNNLEQKKKESMDALIRLRGEVEKRKLEVERAENNMQAYKTNLHIVSLEGTKNIVLQELKLIAEQHTIALGKAVIAEKLDEEVQALLKIVPMESIPQVANDKYVQEVKSQLTIAEANLARLRERYKDKYPLVKTELKGLEDLRRSLGLAASNIVQGISHEARIARAQEKELQKRVKDYEDKQLNLDEQGIKYDQLAQETELQKQLHQKVQSSVLDLEVQIPSKINNMRVSDPAVVPLKTIKPRITLTLVLGVIGGLIVACGLAFFVNYLDDSIKTQDDVEIYLRMPFLGYVPNIKSNSVIERDLQSHLHPQSTAAEGFRTIRAAVALMPSGEKQRLLVVTSTIPSEGKSLLASNLAIVTAQTGLKTLLVDVDLRRPSVHKAFQLHSPIGLSSYLNETVNSVEEIVHSSEVPNLDVVCAGAIPNNPSELCSSKRMRQFLTEASKRYDRIFMDCPPVSAVSDPLVIAAVSDGVIFLTKFNKIRREHARKSIQRLQDAGIRILGIVLNDIDFEGKDSYYYSYYYYQNRYYASHYRSDTKEPKLESKTNPVEKS